MRGLMRKDFFLGKHFLIIGIIGFFMMTVLFYLMRFSYIYGNLAKSNSTDPSDIDTAMICVPGIILMILCIQAVNVSIFTDIRSKWHLFLFTTALSEKQIIKTKYAEFLFLYLSVFVISIFHTLIYGLIFGFGQLKMGIYLLLFFLFLAAIVQFLILPFSYRYKSENSVAGRVCLCTIVPAYAAAFLSMDHIADADFRDADIIAWFDAHFIILLCSAIIIFILAMGISYFACISIIKRREALCGA